jgi:lysophospholipase L1-like esterase/predicted esterase
LAIESEGYDWASFFNAKGIAYFVLKYRMPHGDRTIPTGDAYHAMRTVRDSSAQWKINPNDVGIMGFSAGGHLASTVSTHAPYELRPNFSILMYPVISMDERVTHKGSCTNFLGEEQKNKKLIDEYSNDKQVSRHLTPPAVIIFANDDRIVPPVTNGIAYYSAMRNAGNDCSLYCYPKGGHGFGFSSDFAFHRQMLNDLSNWLDYLKAPKEDAVRVACIGNSITDGFGIDMCDAFGYPAQLQQMLGNSYWVQNFAVSGRTMLNKGDLPYMSERAWKDAQAFLPQIVIIKLGTNDSKPNNWKYNKDFYKDMQSMIDTLKSLSSKPKIYMATPITASKAAYGITISDSVIVNSIIPIINKVAKKNKLEVIDLNTEFRNINDKTMQSDGIHPTAEGAKQMATIIMKKFKK